MNEVKKHIAEINTFINDMNTELSRLSSFHEKLELIDKRCSFNLSRLIIKLAKNKSTARLKELRMTITEYRKSVPLGTGITNQILSICQQILAFGIAGFALSLGFLDKIHTLHDSTQRLITIGGVFYGQLMLVSLYVLILYMAQARFRYPFLHLEKTGNSWLHFYYASISEDVPYSTFQTKSSKLKANTLYAQDFLKFVGKTVSIDEKRLLKAELQQYFLLISLQGYNNQQSLRLANHFIYGFLGVSLGLILIVIAVLTNAI